MPSLPCSCPGSTRASIEVLSQIEPTPGAVAAAQAVPEDCEGGASGENFCRSTSALVEVEGWLTTVMSAPMRVSQNGVSDCLTVTAEVPFAPGVRRPRNVAAVGGLRCSAAFGCARLRVEASTLSWLQSRFSGVDFGLVGFVDVGRGLAFVLGRFRGLIGRRRLRGGGHDEAHTEAGGQQQPPMPPSC